MDKYRDEVKLAIIGKAFGFPLDEKQQSLLETWTDTSPHHKEVVDNFCNPAWREEQTEIIREFVEEQQDKVYLDIMTRLRESNNDESTFG